MTSGDRLHDKVLSYAHAEIQIILAGSANPQFHFDQLLRTLGAFVHCEIVTQDEADSILTEAKAALGVAVQNIDDLSRLPAVARADEPDKT